MIRLPALCVILSACAVSAQPKFPQPPSVIPDPVQAGEELAAKMRASAPSEEAEFTGKFVIVTEGGLVSEVPVASVVSVNPTNWQVVYQTFDKTGAPAESLRIVHCPDRPNACFFSPDSARVSPSPVSGAELARPFGGSDFWLMDLGLEFFQWPGQRLLRNEMRRTRPCHVLQSSTTNSAPDRYVRVLSWIDTESGGLIRAEAYDSSGKLVKEFNVGKFTKIDGRWHLSNMRITSEKTGRETELRFDLKKKER